MTAYTRRSFTRAAAAMASALAWGIPAQAQGQRIGVLMLHGKSPGGPDDPNFLPFQKKFESLGWLALLPNMPWSRNRYLQGDLDQALEEMAGHVRTLRSQGATQIVLLGHSMGVPAAMAYAARGGDVQALVGLAPGHAPLLYDTAPSLSAVHDSIAQARELVAAGKGEETQGFMDINQGRQQRVIMPARDYLSYFDPASDAEMSVTAPKLPPALPVFIAVGQKDPLFKHLRRYFFDKLPDNPHKRYLEVPGGHLQTPGEAYDAYVAWITQVLQAPG